MKYQFEFTERAKRSLGRISQPDALLILRELTLLGEDPYAPGPDVKKLAGHSDLYRLRVGAFRVAYTIDNGALVILVIHVGHRRDVYNRL